MLYRPQCTHTRRNYHVFGKETHRCPCGRWERGFAPAKPEKPKFECQVCGAHQCVSKGGTLVLHGYQRPGDGYIHGTCFGVGYLPYHDVVGLVRYLDVCKGWLKQAEEALIRVTEADELTHVTRKNATFTLTPADTTTRLINNEWVPSFSQAKGERLGKIDAQIKSIKTEIRRVDSRITDA